MAKVLVLFVKRDESESKKLKDYLQAKLGSGVNLNSVKEVLAEDLDPNNELTNSGCILLVSSKESHELVKEKRCENEGNFVLFDGKLIHEHIEKRALLDRLIIIQFGKDRRQDYIPSGFDNKRVFLLNEDFSSQDPILDQIVDTMKGTLSLKLSGKPAQGKEKGKKGNCVQM